MATTNLSYTELPQDVTEIDVLTNSTFQEIGASVSRQVSINMATADPGDTTITTTLTDPDNFYHNVFFDCTGAMTQDNHLIVPASEKLFVVKNSTTGGFAVKVAVTGLGGAILTLDTQDETLCYCDGTDVVSVASAAAGGAGSGALTTLTGGGNRQYLGTIDIAGLSTTGTTYTNTNIPNMFGVGHKKLILVFQDVVTASGGGTLELKISTSSTVRTTSYECGLFGVRNGTDFEADATTHFPIANVSDTSSNHLPWAEVEIFDPDDATYYKYFRGRALSRVTEVRESNAAGGWVGTPAALDGFHLEISANTVSTGTVHVFAEDPFDAGSIATGGVWQLANSYDIPAGTSSYTLSDIDWTLPDTEWEIIITDADLVTTAALLELRVDVGSGFASDANYWTAAVGHLSNGTGADRSTETANSLIVGVAQEDSGQDFQLYSKIRATNLGRTDNYKTWVWESGGYYSASAETIARAGMSQYRGSTNAIEGVQILSTDGSNPGGTFACRVSVYRRSLVSPSVLPVGGGVSVVQREEFSATSSMNFIREIDANGDLYLLTANVTMSADNGQVHLTTSSDTGSTFDTGATDYSWGFMYHDTAVADSESSGDNSIRIGNSIGFASGEKVFIKIWIYNPSDTGYTYIDYTGTGKSAAGTLLTFHGSGVRNTAALVDALQLSFEAATGTGTATLYKYWNHERRGESNPAVMSNRNSTAKIWTKQDGSIDFYADATTANTLAGHVDTSGRLIWGHDTSVQVAGSDGLVQLIGEGSSPNLSLARFENAQGSASILFGKSRGATATSFTIVQDNDVLGSIWFNGADGTDLGTLGANIRAVVDGTPAANRMPTELQFWTAEGASDDDAVAQMWLKPDGRLMIGLDSSFTNPTLQVRQDGASGITNVQVFNDVALLVEDNGSSSIMIATPNTSIGRLYFADQDDGDVGALVYDHSSNNFYIRVAGAEAMRIDSSQRLLVGHTASVSVGEEDAIQITGTSTAESALSISRWQTASSGASILNFGKSRSGTIGSHTSGAMQDNDVLGSLRFYGSDGTGFIQGARIQAKIDETPGIVGTNDLPTELEFFVNSGGAGDTVRMKLQYNGTLWLEQDTQDNGFFDFRATADADTTSAISTLNTSGATTDHIQISLNGTKAWIAVSTNAPT